MAARRYTNKETKEMTDEIMQEANVKALDAGQGCPPIEMQAYQEAIYQEAQNLKMFAKAQEQVRKAIKLRLTEILESIDPKNMGKSREVFNKNPMFDRTEKRTDSDSNPCVGDNPFFVRDWEEIYNPFKFKENTFITMINMARGENKDIIKELKEAKRKLLASQREARAAKEALKDIEENSSQSAEGNKPKVGGLMGDEWVN